MKCLSWAPRLTVALLVLLPLAARADAAAPPPPRVKIAVLDVRATGPIDPKQVEGLSSLLVAEASQDPRLKVTSSQDVRTILGFEAERQLLSCGDSGCLAEVGGALGVSYIVSAEVSRVGRLWLLTVSLLDMAKAEAVHRASRRVDDETALVEAAESALAETLSRIPGVGAPAGALARPPAGGRGAGWLKWTLGGTGGAALLAGGVLYGLAASASAGWNAQDGSVSLAQARTARDTYQPVGLGLLVGGAALVATGVLLPAPSSGPTLQVTVDPRSGRAMAALTFELR